MIGLIKNEKKVPFISLESFIDEVKLQAALEEMEAYKVKQDTEGAEVFVGYNGFDWNIDEEFQNRQKEVLPLTMEYIKLFCKDGVPFNIRYSPKDENIVLLHQDWQPNLEKLTPVNSLPLNYKELLDGSIHDLLLEKDGFKIVDNEADVNPIYNGLDLDFEAVIKEEQGDNYEEYIKNTYKLHLIISPTKTLFIYDNVEDVIYPIDCRATIFNARDYHDADNDSYGISIQFPMNPMFLTNLVKAHCEIDTPLV
jgi:hypothetical protein